MKNLINISDDQVNWIIYGEDTANITPNKKNTHFELFMQMFAQSYKQKNDNNINYTNMLLKILANIEDEEADIRVAPLMDDCQKKRLYQLGEKTGLLKIVQDEKAEKIKRKEVTHSIIFNVVKEYDCDFSLICLKTNKPNYLTKCMNQLSSFGYDMSKKEIMDITRSICLNK